MRCPNFIKILVLGILFNLCLALAYRGAFTYGAESKVSGEKLFKTNCSGCHLNGKNLIKPDKPIIGSLKLKSREGFKSFIESPPPPMPKFKNITAKEAQLDALYSYVTSLMGK